VNDRLDALRYAHHADIITHMVKRLKQIEAALSLEPPPYDATHQKEIQEAFDLSDWLAGPGSFHKPVTSWEEYREQLKAFRKAPSQ
jgi:hypothetical protein